MAWVGRSALRKPKGQDRMMTGLGVGVVAAGKSLSLALCWSSLKCLLGEEGNNMMFQESSLPALDQLHQEDYRWFLKKAFPMARGELERK